MDYPNRLEWQTRCEFNAYCKRALRNELIDACRERKRRQLREVIFSDLTPQEEIMDGEIHVAEYTSPMLWLPCWFRTVRAYLNLPP
jgi:DNA-directed RNA polymerase specialized sigma24 family protein